MNTYNLTLYAGDTHYTEHVEAHGYSSEVTNGVLIYQFFKLITAVTGVTTNKAVFEIVVSKHQTLSIKLTKTVQ